jgi:hypothetical protein
VQYGPMGARMTEPIGMIGSLPGPNLRNKVILRRFPGPARPSGATPRLARTPGEPNDITLRGLFAFTVLRPRLSELPPLLEQVTSTVRGFDLVADGVCQRHLADLGRKVRLFGTPIGKGRSEPVRSEIAAAHPTQQLQPRSDGEHARQKLRQRPLGSAETEAVRKRPAFRSARPV